MALPSDMLNEFRQYFSGEVRDDAISRCLYSTDASIYQIEPLGVAFPRHVDDLAVAVEIASRYQIAVLARGSGSSIGGQAIGPALILDCSRHLTCIHEINPEESYVITEPGVILSELNRATGKYGLVFGPDPASADRATVGGCMANNATGAHSILYGMSADHLLEADVVLADGTVTTFKAISVADARSMVAAGNSCPSLETKIYDFALEMREKHGKTIQERWPRVWRRASGYGLNYLLPWSPREPPAWKMASREWKHHFPAGALTERMSIPYPPIPDGYINLAPLLAGSEGTLAVMQRLKLRLVPKLRTTILAVLAFDSVAEACDATVELLELTPSAIELVPRMLIQAARSVPAYANRLTFLPLEVNDLLVVEFAGDSPREIASQVERLRSLIGSEKMIIAETTDQQRQVWEVRKVGLGLLTSRPGDVKPFGFIEDVTVPVERLSGFVREIERIVAEHETTAEIYGHASAGCMHVRPLINLKTVQGVKALRSIAEQTVEAILAVGGAVSGEHADGIARGEWIERSFGKSISDLFRRLKRTADPMNIFNPGKKIDAPPMDTNLRYGPDYRIRAWPPLMDFSPHAGIEAAVEMCSGAGVCRKAEGVMCPSFQATKEEMFSTRGRANLLRAMMTQGGMNQYLEKQIAVKAAFEALDLCLACKGCKAECPSAVDMAKLKYEFLHQYYAGGLLGSRRRQVRDYLFAYIGYFAPWGSFFAPLVNRLLASSGLRRLGEVFLGLSAERVFPKFARPKHSGAISHDSADCLLLSDTFSRYFHPETELSALETLRSAGLRVHMLPLLGAGRTLISKGFLRAAREHARQLLEAIDRLDPEGQLPVVGVEPSEIYTLRDEFLSFFPGDERVRRLARRAWMVDEFLIRPGLEGRRRIDRLIEVKSEALAKRRGDKGVLLHGHCYQKAQPPAEDGYANGVAATVEMLTAMGYTVSLIDAGCCGMAGAFGYEAEHYELSMAIGELSLFPAIRQAEHSVIIAAPGTSCRAQIEDGSGRIAVHPITLV